MVLVKGPGGGTNVGVREGTPAREAWVLQKEGESRAREMRMRSELSVMVGILVHGGCQRSRYPLILPMSPVVLGLFGSVVLRG